MPFYYLFLILTLLCCAVVKATSFTSKTFGKFIAGGAAASTGCYLASPQLKYFQESEESLAYWSYWLRRSPGGQYLLRHHLYPKFVLNGRFRSTGESVLLKSLSEHQFEPAKCFLEAGADPNVITHDGRDFFDFAKHKAFPVEIVEAAFLTGLDVNRKNKQGELPLDRVINAGNYDVAAFLVKAGAKSDRSWSFLVAQLADVNNFLTSDPQSFNQSPRYCKHRLIIAIYRANGREDSVLEWALWRTFLRDLKQMRAFLKGIQGFDEMLFKQEAKYHRN